MASAGHNYSWGGIHDAVGSPPEEIGGELLGTERITLGQATG
jgi:hypothetical protein